MEMCAECALCAALVLWLCSSLIELRADCGADVESVVDTVSSDGASSSDVVVIAATSAAFVATSAAGDTSPFSAVTAAQAAVMPSAASVGGDNSLKLFRIEAEMLCGRAGHGGASFGCAVGAEGSADTAAAAVVDADD